MYKYINILKCACVYRDEIIRINFSFVQILIAKLYNISDDCCKINILLIYYVNQEIHSCLT